MLFLIIQGCGQRRITFRHAGLQSKLASCRMKVLGVKKRRVEMKRQWLQGETLSVRLPQAGLERTRGLTGLEPPPYFILSGLLQTAKGKLTLQNKSLNLTKTNNSKFQRVDDPPQRFERYSQWFERS